MIGYCMKDEFKSHYRQCHTPNITPEDMQIAEDAYLQNGAGERRKTKCVLSPNTLFDRASTEMVAGANADDVLELRKQNALCCTAV